jgi:Flp pilus assembly protein TadD
MTVPETKEEIRKRRITRITTAIVIVVVATIAVFVGLHLSHRSAIKEAALLAGDDGRPASIDHALALLADETDPDDLALRARLLAMRVLEANTDDTEHVTSLLEQLPQERSMNAVVASTYLALHANELDRAQSEAALITVGGTYASEAAHARALVAVALGNPEAATAEAQLALERRPGAPRHAALLALIQSRKGEHEAAFETLDAATNPETSPRIRVTRARILLEAGEDPDRAVAEAEAVLGDLADQALSPEIAWARLIRGWGAAGRGDSQAALEDARAADEQRPPADEMFVVALAETYLKAGALDAAAEALGSVQARTAHIRGRQAQIRAELAIARGDDEAARAALEDALPGTRSDLIRARLLEAEGKSAEARELYAQVAEVPAFFVEASARLAALELKNDEAQAASARLGSVLERTPSHPLVAPVAVKAKLALGDAEGAMRIAARALEDHPEDPDLLAARAEVEIENGDDEAALRSLRAAIERRDDDPRLHMMRGKAARRVGEIAEARAAFDAVLERTPNDEEALMAAAELAVEDADPERADQILEMIDDQRIRGKEVDYVRAGYLVGSAAGQRGFLAVRRALARNPRDVFLQNSLGDLFLQAEEWRAAANAFTASKNYAGGEPEPRAILGRTIAQIRVGVLGVAFDNLQAAREAGNELGAPFEARVLAAEARVFMMQNAWRRAEEKAREAIATDPKCSEAHLVLADVLQHKNEPSLPELQLAAEGRIPQPEAMARLYLADQEAEQACGYARGYLRAAPQGRWAERIRDNARRCPR